MRIKLDRTVCDGFGICAERAPDVVSMDEWGYASLRERAPMDVPADREGAARRALLDCPVHAIVELARSSEASADSSAESPADGSAPRAEG